MPHPKTFIDIRRSAGLFYLKHHAFASKVSGHTFGTATTGPGMPDFMRRCVGKVMVNINDVPDIRRTFQRFHIEQLNIRYSVTNQSVGGSGVNGELIILNWRPDKLGVLL